MQSTKGLTANTALKVSKKGAAYKPQANSMQNNNNSWGLVQAAFAANGKQTYGTLVTALRDQANHGNFIGYCIRRGWLVTK